MRGKKVSTLSPQEREARFRQLMLVIVVTVFIADTLWTAFLLREGLIIEANPLVRPMLQWGLGPFIAIRLVYAALFFSSIFWLITRYDLRRRYLYLLVGGYCLLLVSQWVLNNTALSYQVKNWLEPAFIF